MPGKFSFHDHISCDVLVVGAGGAGLRCVTEILEHRPDTNILVVTKVSHPQKSHTGTAQGGLAAVDPDDPIDSPIYHMFDTWKGSDCTADQNVVQRIVESAWDEILWLERRGMFYTRNEEGKLAKRTFGGHSIRFGEASAFRAVFESDRTGKGILDTMWGEAVKKGVKFYNQHLLTELLFNHGACVGAVLFDHKKGRFISVAAKMCVLSTGGSGQVFRVTTNCRHNTGDGLGVILQHGLPVMDPEAVQFHPTGVVGPGILASEALRGEGGILRNKNLEPYMEKYAPKMKDLAPRDVVSRANELEIREGRGVLNPDHNIEHVWIDLRHLSDYVHDVKLKEISTFFKKFVNIDPKTQLAPVRPSNHYHMGGIPTTLHGEVQDINLNVIPGLYAIGECACASFHGFNRLATNSILELITMGKIVGQTVLTNLKQTLTSNEPASEKGEYTFDKFSRYLNAQGKHNVDRIKSDLRSTMSDKVGVFRDEKGLTSALDTIHELQEAAQNIRLECKSLTMNQELAQRWELDNLLTVSLVIAQSALERRESRGAHTREDYPERQDAFNYHTLAQISPEGNVVFSQRPINMDIFESGADYADKFGYISRKY